MKALHGNNLENSDLNHNFQNAVDLSYLRESIKHLTLFLTQRTTPHAFSVFSGDLFAAEQLMLRWAASLLYSSDVDSYDEKDIYNFLSHGAGRANNPLLAKLSFLFRMISNNQHPDFLCIDKIITEDSKTNTIGIDHIRSAKEFYYSTPVKGKYKFVLILDGSKLRPPASDALLKMLEEPTDHSVIAIITPKVLRPTLHSRCYHLKIPMMGMDSFIERLAKTYDLDRHTASVTYQCSEGNMRIAEQLLTEPCSKLLQLILPNNRYDENIFEDICLEILDKVTNAFPHIQRLVLFYAYRLLNANILACRNFSMISKWISTIENVQTLLDEAESCHLDKTKVIPIIASLLKTL